MLKITDFTKKYGDKIAVDNLSLELFKGEICGFIGHNGAGKTTTLKAAIGLLDFDGGTIEIDGISIKENPLECKRITAYIPDNPELYDYISGIKYLNFVCDVYKIGDERNALIKEYADRLGLTESLASPIGSYSHGMKQKLAIISAWIHSPRFIMMDEPFVGLDPKASFTLKEMMREHCEKGGTIFFSTHVLDVAEKLCDRIAIIKSGKLVTIGDTEKVKGSVSLEEVFLDLEEEQ